IAGYLYDTQERPFRVRHLLVEDCPVNAEGLAVLNDESHDEFVRSTWLGRGAMMASETPGYEHHPGVLQVFEPAGIRDVLVLNAIDPIGVGCWVGAPWPERKRLEGAEREFCDRLVAQLRSALRLRLRLVPSAVGQQGADDTQGEEGPESAARLAERERQVVSNLSLGLTNKEIAFELGLAHSTVRVLVARAAAKLGVKTRAELVARYRRGVLG
ncbi:MAG TPA: helix-turn-helix transcriptional regulator, partial [Polyangiaceae bacterium]|nr:helix-turn-helix transcriptional regulator [Polyangiaceae bacterium]